ncbi:hypothetical protein K523DRAFT_320029, partial [Schizophyllum commune Tattone D]
MTCMNFHKIGSALKLHAISWGARGYLVLFRANPPGFVQVHLGRKEKPRHRANFHWGCAALNTQLVALHFSEDVTLGHWATLRHPASVSSAEVLHAGASRSRALRGGMQWDARGGRAPGGRTRFTYSLLGLDADRPTSLTSQPLLTSGGQVQAHHLI